MVVFVTDKSTQQTNTIAPSTGFTTKTKPNIIISPTSGIYYPSTDNFRIYTNNTDAIIIDSSGVISGNGGGLTSLNWDNVINKPDIYTKSEVNQISSLNNFFNKGDTLNILNNYYTNTQVDEIANLNNFYNKTDTDTLLNTKENTLSATSILLGNGSGITNIDYNNIFNPPSISSSGSALPLTGGQMDGGIGFGITQPSYGLKFYSSSSSTTSVIIIQNDIYKTLSIGVGGSIVSDPFGNNAFFRASTNMCFFTNNELFTPIMRMGTATNNYIGINNNTPNYTLDVYGNINSTTIYRNGVELNTLYQPKINTVSISPSGSGSISGGTLSLNLSTYTTDTELAAFNYITNSTNGLINYTNTTDMNSAITTALNNNYTKTQTDGLVNAKQSLLTSSTVLSGIGSNITLLNYNNLINVPAASSPLTFNSPLSVSANAVSINLTNYLTTLAASTSYLALTGGTMSGNLTFAASKSINFTDSLLDYKINLYGGTYGLGVRANTLVHLSPGYHNFYNSSSATTATVSFDNAGNVIAKSFTSGESDYSYFGGLQVRGTDANTLYNGTNPLGLTAINNIIFNTGTTITNYATRMIINTNGNVGIGSSVSPQTNLEVFGTNPAISIKGTGEADNAILYLGTPYGGISALKCAIIAQGQSTWSRSKLHFCLNNAANNTYPTYNATVTDSKMSLDYNGNLAVSSSISFPSTVSDNKIVLYTGYGFGVNDFTLRYNSLGIHKFYNNGVETFNIDGSGNINIPGDINVTGVINKSSPGFLMVYNASGPLGAAFYYNMNTFLSTHNTNTYMYYIYDNLGNIYSGQFLTTLIAPYTMRIITGIAYAANTTFITISAGLDTATPPNCWFYTKGSPTNSVVYLKIK